MADQQPGLFEQLTALRRTVDVEPLDLSIRELAHMAQVLEIRRDPVYQRKFRWRPPSSPCSSNRCCWVSGTLAWFVATNADGTWELVDGLQRLSTILHFLEPDALALTKLAKEDSLRLEGLEKLTSFNGKRYEDLPKAVQLHFQRRSLRITILSDKSDPDVRYDLFERLNRGAVKLTAQEVRTCAYRGSFLDFLKELADMPISQSAQAARKNNKTGPPRNLYSSSSGLPVRPAAIRRYCGEVSYRLYQTVPAAIRLRKWTSDVRGSHPKAQSIYGGSPPTAQGIPLYPSE